MREETRRRLLHPDPADHEHGHSHAPKDFGAAFAIATALNVALVGLQVVFGLLGHSVALLADAGHNAGDALGLVLAWGAHVLSKRLPTQRYTYGFRSASILASFLNASILLIATGAIAIEAIRRFFEPAPVEGMTVIVVASIAIVLNALAAWVLMGGKSDLNIRGAFHAARKLTTPQRGSDFIKVPFPRVCPTSWDRQMTANTCSIRSIGQGHCGGARRARHSCGLGRQMVRYAGGAVAGGCQPFRRRRRKRGRVRR